jgi:Xaa-Pro aminopeptidase
MSGVMALEDGARVDFAALRAERRRRVFAAMEAQGLDALVLGRTAHVRFTTGARQLWRAGASSFAPMCVVVAQTGRIHMLSTWDEGIPPEIGRDDLYGLFWDPGHLIAALTAIPGLGEARRIGTDSLNLFFGRVLGDLAPGAALVDAGVLLTEVRSRKSPAELACLQVAAALAEAGLGALEAALAPGITERALLGVYVQALAALGAPTPPSESAVLATPRQGSVRFRALATDRPIERGDLVVLSPGALFAGYEAGLARTRTAGAGASPAAAALARRCHAALDALVAACRPGGTGGDLLRAWESTGEPPAGMALAHGMGIGAEAPVIGLGRGADAPLHAGMVLSVQAWVSEQGTGGFLERELVSIGENGPEVLTRSER